LRRSFSAITTSIRGWSARHDIAVAAARHQSKPPNCILTGSPSTDEEALTF
jgi:hypothetical protein